MYGQSVQFRFGGPLTPMVKRLMIANAVIFLAQQIIGQIFPDSLEFFFGLSHAGLIHEFKIWQILTYMFFHGGWLHIIFNLLALWMFGGELEQIWGGRLFLKFYLYTGVGAGAFIAAMNYYIFMNYNANPVTIGASGAIYGILLAYGLTWPNREVLLYFIIPVKIKYLVIIFGLIEFFGTLSSVSGKAGGISHIGHLGGLISGFIYIMYKSKFSSSNKEGFFGKLLQKIKNKNKKKVIDNRIIAKRIIDELLEKIARNGMSSLTPEEKKQLDWARKNYYPDRNETLH